MTAALVGAGLGLGGVVAQPEAGTKAPVQEARAAAQVAERFEQAREMGHPTEASRR